MSGLIGHFGCRVAPEAPAWVDAGPPPRDSDDTSGYGTGGTGGTASTGGSAGTKSTATPAKPSSAASGTASNGGAASDAEGEPAAGAPGAAEKPGGNGSPSASAACGAQTVTFDEIRRGEVRSNVKVEVLATATSQKFLLSHARSGSCLFGAFVGVEPGEDGPRGLRVVSYGDDAAEGESCATGTDGIPDDLSPGDALSADGYLSAYAPSGCEAAPSPQLMVDAACPLVRSGRREPPSPVTLTAAEGDAIARGTDVTLLRRFAGGLVRLEHVSAALPSDGNGAVAPYGVIALNETDLAIHNDLEYGDLTHGGPGSAEKSLVFPFPTTFSAVTGLVYLDYCSWSLAPRSRCTDLDPASRNCP